MPNHIYNKLKISGTEKEINMFKILAKDIKEIFSISRLYPMPKELEGISSPPEILKGIEYIKAKIEYDKNKKSKTDTFKGRPINSKMDKELKQQFGANNWYD